MLPPDEIAMICQSPINMNIILMAIGFADLRFHVTFKNKLYTHEI